MRIRKKILLGIVTVFALLFLYTGIAKLLNYQHFIEGFEGSVLLKPFAHLPVWVVPTVEVLVPFLLVSKKYRLLGLYLCFIAMAVFTMYVAALDFYSDDIPCDCGGYFEKLSPGMHVLANSLLATLAMGGIILEKKLRRQSNQSIVD